MPPELLQASKIENAPIVISPQKFAAELRANLGLAPNVSFTVADISRAAEKYPRLFPVAFFYSLDRLNLILQAPPGRIVIYDPMIGLRRIFDPLEQNAGSFLTNEHGRIKLVSSIEAVRASGYALPLEPVRRLCPMTRDLPNSGAFSTYAAYVARGLITPTL